jgi:hypothetical protein
VPYCSDATSKLPYDELARTLEKLSAIKI